MSVLVTLKAEGDPAKLVALNEANPQRIRDVAARGKQAGAIHHAFWANGSTVLVVDEWPDAETFQKFFAASTDIPPIMAESGVTAEPEITFWERIELGDEF
jgi:hypothetical protein